MRHNLLVMPALLLSLGSVACGSTSDLGSGAATPTPTADCTQQAKLPGYSNGITTVPNQATSLSGAGSTFINPIMTTWAGEYAKTTGVQVAYQSIGSGGGVKQIQAGTVDFGASDAYMSDADIAGAKGPVLQVPLALAPVVVTYNVSGLGGGLNFDGSTLGRIYAGQITTWNDPAITALNPGKTLPNEPIAVVHRSDGSGTTSIFTDYLTKESPDWVQKLGGKSTSVGKTVVWPLGIGGKGNDGVSGAVSQTQGAIGYVELAYAIQQQLPYGNVKNQSGKMVQPCTATVEAATEGVQYPADLRFDLTDGAQAAAYPITGVTWALLYQNQTDAAKAAAQVNFFSWVLTKGQDLTVGINYTPLGSDLQQRSLAQLHKVTVNGQPVAAT